MRARKMIWLLGFLLALAGCSESTVSTENEVGAETPPPVAESSRVQEVELSPSAAAAREVLTAAPWLIDERAGFENNSLSGLVSFRIGNDGDALSLEAAACGLSQSAAIMWNEAGFVIIEDVNLFPSVEGGEGCQTNDDLITFLFRDVDAGQVFAELSADGTRAFLQKGDQTLTLRQTGSPANDDDLAAVATTTTAAATTTIPTRDGLEIPGATPVPNATFSGSWGVVALSVNGEAIALDAGRPQINFTGRSYGGNDGCNSFGGGGAVWSSDGTIRFSQVNEMTLVDCGDDAVTSITSGFGRALREATSWGLTEDANLIVAGSNIIMELERTGPPNLEGGAIEAIPDGRLELLRETEFFSRLPVDVELPILTIDDDGTVARLSSSECEITWDLQLPGEIGEGTFSLTNPSPPGCPRNSLADEIVAEIRLADYALTGTFNGASILQLWGSSELLAVFATEGSGLDG